MSDSTAFPRPLWPYCAGLFAAACAIAALSWAASGPPGLVPFLVFGILVVFTRHRDVTLPNGAFMSPGLMVVMASLVVFEHEGTTSGVVLIGLLNGLYLPSLTRRSWGWIPFNAGVTGIALYAAALSYELVPGDLPMPGAVLAAIPPALAVTAVVWALIVVSYVIEQGHVPGEMVRELGPSFVHALPFALLGYLVGRLFIDLGPGVMLLIVVPILIAREMFAAYLKVKESHDETVQMLIRALEQKDRYTAGHAERVARYAQYMGEELQFGPARLERLRFAALMHDIGKLVVPNHLLNKPGKLTEDEFARIRIHEKVSVQMLSHIDFLRPIAATTHSDAMRFVADDDEHPIEPYIIMIADAYDAMTSTRSYRKALPQEVAFAELRDKAGTQFHPRCVEALIGAIERRGEHHGAGHEEHAEFADAPEGGLGSAGLGDLLPTEAAAG